MFLYFSFSTGGPLFFDNINNYRLILQLNIASCVQLKIKNYTRESAAILLYFEVHFVLQDFINMYIWNDTKL